jgi:hypothetical protein
VDVHIFEPQGISFLETESTFMTKELAEALTTSQNKTKVGLPYLEDKDTHEADPQSSFMS